MRKTLVLIATLAALLSAQTPSGPSPASVPLNIGDAEAIAVKNHPQILAAGNNAAAAGQMVGEARAAYYPLVNGEVTGSQGYDLGRVGAGALSASRLFNRFGAGLQIQQLVTDFGRTYNLVANSRLQAQAANQNVTATRYDVLIGVDRAYYEVLQDQAFVTVAQETVKARQTLADQVNALFKAQLKSEVDLSFAQVNVSEGQLLLIRAQDSVKQAEADLGRALGVDRPDQYQLSEPLAAPAPPADLQLLIDQAVQGRPELASLRLQYQATEKFEAAERDLSHPTLAGIAVGGALPYVNAAGLPPEYEGIALNLQIPLFNGHLYAARREAAHQEALAANQHLRDELQQVEHDVNNAWVAVSTAYQRIPVTVDMMKQAQLALDLAQGRYKLGLSSIVEVTQAQLNLTQAQIENVTAKYDYASAYAQLQYTIGALR